MIYRVRQGLPQQPRPQEQPFLANDNQNHCISANPLIIRPLGSCPLSTTTDAVSAQIRPKSFDQR